MAQAIRKLSPEAELRQELAWDLHLALRHGRVIAFHHAAGEPTREDAAHAVYESSIGTPALIAAYHDAVQAVARGESFGRVGELFAAFQAQASACNQPNAGIRRKTTGSSPGPMTVASLHRQGVAQSACRAAPHLEPR